MILQAFSCHIFQSIKTLLKTFLWEHARNPTNLAITFFQVSPSFDYSPYVLVTTSWRTSSRHQNWNHTEGWSKLHCRHDQTCRWRAQDGLTGIYPFAEAEPASNRGYAAGEGGVGSVVVHHQAGRQVPLGRGRRRQRQPEV